MTRIELMPATGGLDVLVFTDDARDDCGSTRVGATARTVVTTAPEDLRIAREARRLLGTP